MVAFSGWMDTAEREEPVVSKAVDMSRCEDTMRKRKLRNFCVDLESGESWTLESAMAEISHRMVAEDKLRADLANLRKQHAALREAAFAVTDFAKPYWLDGHHPKAIAVGDEALLRLDDALYPEDERRG